MSNYANYLISLKLFCTSKYFFPNGTNFKKANRKSSLRKLIRIY